MEAADERRLQKLIAEARERLMMDQPWAADAKLREATGVLSPAPVVAPRARLVSRGFTRGRAR